MNEALLNLGFDEVGQTSSKKYANKPRKKKTKQINKNNRERKGNPKPYLQYEA